MKQHLIFRNSYFRHSERSWNALVLLWNELI